MLTTPPCKILMLRNTHMRDLRTLVSAVMNLQVPWNAGNFLTSCKPVSFSRRTLHHGVSNGVREREREEWLCCETLFLWKELPILARENYAFSFIDSLWNWCNAALSFTPAANPHFSHTLMIIQETVCVGNLLYTQSNKNPSAWYFVHPAQAVTCGTVAIIIRVVLLSPYLCIRGVSLSSIHYNQSHCVYINRRQQYSCLIWN